MAGQLPVEVRRLLTSANEEEIHPLKTFSNFRAIFMLDRIQQASSGGSVFLRPFAERRYKIQSANTKPQNTRIELQPGTLRISRVRASPR